jgi:thiamine transport system permease protein
LISRPILRRMSKRYQRAMDIVFQMPVGISSVVLGLGYLVSFSGGFFPLRSSWLVTPIAQSLLSIPLVIRLIHPAITTIDRELLESAETDSANSSQIWWLIEIPIIRDVLVIATGYVMIISIGEFGAANFLAYGDQGTLPTVLYQLISRPGAQNYGMAMAASSLLIGVAFVIVYMVSAFDRHEE